MYIIVHFKILIYINQTIIKKIVAMSLTERVYTHFEIQQLVDAIDMI